MLLKIRKSSAIYFITNDTPKGRLINLSSHLYLNLHQITELSHYTLKTSLDKQSVDGKKLTLTPDTKVLHLSMAPTFASYEDKAEKGRRLHERRFYTLHFLPEAIQEYLAIRQALNGQILNDD
ncbi:hypothetical protein [Marinospirillum sp.]|uniref:hypothetical protein n=1 Tax=Marinospirillum sp. TaxID=2183934 RepID=UPI002870279C|nr:hypothetical protein [Marinospirillum sp.]MDR9468107.1 hypothetical protein [Marinospirillum sp.]